MPATQPSGPTTTHTITFQDPPGAGRRGRTDWQAIADQLRSRPGEWAIVAENTHGVTAHYIKTGSIAAFRPAGAFEAVTRSNAPAAGERRTFTVYARFAAEAAAA